MEYYLIRFFVFPVLVAISSEDGKRTGVEFSLSTYVAYSNDTSEDHGSYPVNPRWTKTRPCEAKEAQRQTGYHFASPELVWTTSFRPRMGENIPNRSHHSRFSGVTDSDPNLRRLFRNICMDGRKDR